MEIKVWETMPLEGVFFRKGVLAWGDVSEQEECSIVNIFDDIEYQEVIGFGGAFTEAAAYNYALLDAKNKAEFLQKYFSRENGIGYNFGRTHINSCDFSLDIYSYVEDGDETLETFTIDRDRKYIIPFLKDAQAVCKEDLIIIASPWSPPAYMKDNACATQGGKLISKYQKLWALYYAKYIQAYRQEGIQISAITIQNEPKATQTWESCTWTGEEEGSFIEHYLIPTFQAEGLTDIKIIVWDHNKERVYERATEILRSNLVREHVWAVGQHWYSGDHFEGLSLVYEKLDKPNICTEFCIGDEGFGDPLDNAEKYAKSICQNLNHYMIASCDWNLLLDDEGGPFHNRLGGGCNAPVRLDRATGALEYTAVYYYIGHFSKFIQRGAKRIAITRYTDQLYVSAFKNPDGTIVAVIMNPNDEARDVILRMRRTNTFYRLAAHSIATIVMACRTP